MDSTVLDAGIAAQQLQLVNAIVDEDRQYATRLTITRTDNENASESVISTVISWLMKKKVLSKEHCDSFREGTYSTPDGWNGTTELEQGKTALASKRNSGVPGCVVWAMELDEQDHRLIYGRWHTRNRYYRKCRFLYRQHPIEPLYRQGVHWGGCAADTIYATDREDAF